MPKRVVELTDVEVKRARPGEKTKYLFDGGGLYLEIFPDGTRRWRFRYRLHGKAHLLSLGNYPGVSLNEARTTREMMRKQVRAGIDPAATRKAGRAAGQTVAGDSFEVIAREWFETKTVGMVAGHRKRVMDRLEKDLLPWLGSRHMVEITPPDLLTTIRRIEARGAVETARRALGDLSRIFRYAVATGRIPSDPSRDLRGALPPPQEKHFAAITDQKALGTLLQTMEGYRGTLPVKVALLLAPLLVVRPGELRKMEWTDVNLEAAEWRFTVTKTKTLHCVPLCRRAVDLLRELHPLTGRGRFVFPNPRTPDGSRPMSENAVVAALANLGYKWAMTGHGWRAVFRTLGDEVLRFRPDLIEAQLAHTVRDPNGRAYNRTSFIEDRREMMQRWADYLDGLRAGQGDQAGRRTA
ncbi:MAG: integrase arm-type DNA-binding domain-containing protein [Candidatus Riflebacteria bacterium]|nr:integrase arm-type DNA-binding domain-containing protein [Candidatus Riflebacteria bacterium]